MRQYRLITDNPMTGARNMALDEAILHSVAARDSLPTLRFYAWEPACLSIGYGQRVNDADTDHLQSAGWSLVRRPTGGKAILHADEMTYSLSLPEDHALAEGGIVESYRHISRALLAGLGRIGLSPRADRKADDAPALGAVCFEVPSHYEITTGDGKKLLGSAQLRRKGGVLQHGSLPLYGDIGRICDVLHYDNVIEREEGRFAVRRRAATLADALDGEKLSWETLSSTR
jgi:lipoate-protein ligase A